MLDDRLTEQRNPCSEGIDAMSALEIVRVINGEDAAVAAAVRSEEDAVARAVEIALDSFRAGGRLLYVGAGTSGRLGVLDAAEMPPTYGTDPAMVQGVIAGGRAALVRAQEGAEDDPATGAAAMDERDVGERDFVLGIATSGTTPYVHGALARARERGARTGFLLCTPPPPALVEAHDVVIAPLVGPEVVTGSTRMKAGTATKMVLNAITTTAMVLFGKVHGNLMVDLQVTCAKLQDRGERILMTTLEVGREEARELLDRAGGHVKTALAMHRTGAGAAEARAALARAGGVLAALGTRRPRTARGPGAAAAAGLVCLLAWIAPALAAQTVPPDEPWRQFRSEHFEVTYPEPLEALARRASVHAERAWDLLAERFVDIPRTPVQILLTDHADISNGLASPVPYNRIVVYARPPMDGGSLSYFDDWLGLVVTHELVHTFHLDMSGGLGGVVRALFGRVPMGWPVFPSASTPTWFTEGLATWYESELTGAGRVKGTWQEMVLRVDALEGGLAGVDKVSGSSPVWPAGHRPYVYGARYMDHLAERYGEESLAGFARSVAGLWAPYWFNAALRDAFGTDLEDEWDDWTESAAREYEEQAARIERDAPVTEGEVVDDAGRRAEQAVVSPAGSVLAFIRSDGVDQTQIRVADPDGGGARSLTRVNGVGGSLSWGPGGRLHFTQLDFSDPYRMTSDLYRADLDGSVVRLTRGLRISFADVSPDGTSAIAVQEGGGTNALVLVDTETGEAATLVEPDPDTHWAWPRWSPDGAEIAAVRWRAGAMADIVILDREGAVTAEVTRDRAVDTTPFWSPDGRTVVWSSDRTGIPNLFAAAVEGEGAAAGRAREIEVRQITNMIGGATHPSVDPDGRWIHFSSYHSDGWHVERIPYAPGDWFEPRPASPRFTEEAGSGTGAAGAPAAGAAPADAAPGDSATTGGAARGYRPFRTMLPYAWRPLWDPAVEGTTTSGAARTIIRDALGIEIDGSDLVGRHSWRLAVRRTLGWDRGTGGFAYVYRGLGNPGIGFSFNQSYDANPAAAAVRFPDGSTREYFLVEQDRLYSLNSTLTRRRYRSHAALTLSAALGSTHRTLQGLDGSPGPELTRPRPRYRYGEFRATISAANSQVRAFSISREDGVRGFASWRTRLERDLAAESRGVAGDDGSFGELTGEISAFKSLGRAGFANQVLAARLSAGVAYGPDAHQYHFGLGDAEGTPEPVTGLALFGGGSRLFPLRGYPRSHRTGAVAWSFSAEYRIPLLLMDRSMLGLPIHLDRLHGSIFFDAGNAWGPTLGLRNFDNPRQGALASAGAELSVIVAPIYERSFSIRFGAGLPLVEGSGARFHVRVGNAF